MSVERDYVLGTHDDEIERLGLQHRVWRPRALDAWQRAGFSVGQTLLDLGCGPGYATVDLAEIVGPAGRVVAVDRSRRFLDALAARDVGAVQTFELDLDEDDLPRIDADGAWARWVFAFVKRPRDLLAKVRRALRPGGVLVLHEYFDYSTWRLAPRSREFEEFVAQVMVSWRASGGEPDIALDLLRWLEELGFEIRSLRPIVDIVEPPNFFWQWPKSFVDVGLRRLVDLGHFSVERARRVREVRAAHADHHAGGSGDHRRVILSREDGEGSPASSRGIPRFARDDTAAYLPHGRPLLRQLSRAPARRRDAL